MSADEIGRILDELGQRLGPAGEHVWGLAIRWQITAGIVGLIASLVSITLIALAIRFIWRKAEDAQYDSDGSMMRTFSAIFGGLAILFLQFPVWDSLLRLMNPEFSAIRDLIGGGLR